MQAGLLPLQARVFGPGREAETGLEGPVRSGSVRVAGGGGVNPWACRLELALLALAELQCEIWM